MVYGLKIVLASASPRRAKLLKSLGVDFTQVSPTIQEDESIKDPKKRVKVNALRKAMSVMSQHPDSLIIGSDTVIYHDGKVLGKPRDIVKAGEMIRSLSGGKHSVYTGVALIDSVSGRTLTRCMKTEVWFKMLSEDTIDRYLMSEVPLDKAGATSIQGLGGELVDNVEGSYSNVVGLPLGLLREMLVEFHVIDGG